MSNTLLDYFGTKLRYELIYPDKNKQNVYPIASPYGEFDKVKKAIDISNKAGYGVYFTLNEFNNPKHRKKAEFKRARAVWIEDDGDVHGVTPTTFPLAPSCIVESSPGKFHYYWFTSCDDLDEWDAVMHGMCDKFNGDPAGILVTQVLRVPGYANTKYPSKHVVAIRGGNFKTYSWREVIKYYPPAEFNQIKHPETGDVVNRKSVLEVKDAIKDILSGESVYPNMIRLAASFAVKGMNRKDTYSLLKGVLELSDAEPDRLKNAEDKLMYSIDDARAKYAIERSKGRFGKFVQEDLHCTLDWPPGFLGKVARDIYDSMFLQSRELAVVTALHSVSVLGCGAFHWNGVPVNRRRLVLANNGVGKQTSENYFKKLCNNILVPNILERYSSENAFSASNLQHDLNIHKCRSVIIGEAGKIGSSTSGDIGTLQAQKLKLISAKVGEAAVSTTSYSRAGKTIANETKLKPVQDPIVCYLEESTPQTYVDVFHRTKQTESGLLARTDTYFIKEPKSDDINWESNKHDLDETVLKHMTAMVIQYESLDIMDGTLDHSISEKHIEVDFSDVDQEYKEFIIKHVDLRHTANGDYERGLIVRKHERVFTTCIILAAADSLDLTLETPATPKVTLTHWEYALELHEELDRSARANFTGGHLASAMEQALNTLKTKQSAAKDGDAHLLTKDGYITRQWVSKKLRTNESKFKNLKHEMPFKENSQIYTSIINSAIDEGMMEKAPGVKDSWINLMEKE